MPRVVLPLPLFIPQRVYNFLRKLRNESESAHPVINLLGDRDIEWSWIASEIPNKSGEALDFGPGGSSLGLVASMRGYHVLSVDLGSINWPYIHPRMKFQQGDILKLELVPGQFDLIMNCSTIEHVGLVGRYGTTHEESNGDFIAMNRLRNLLKVNEGKMLLTIPVGKDAVFSPLTRVYGAVRLPKLLEGFDIEKEVFWTKDQQNKWIQTDRDTALLFEASARSWNALKNRYALGCFVLSRKKK